MASSRVVPTGTVTRFSLVMTWPTVVTESLTKRTSRLVTMPTRVSPSTTGRPEMLYSLMTVSACSTVMAGGTVMGEMIMPDSDFLTFSTSSRCWAMVMFLWTTPTPPLRASWMAMRDSVTVSMAALTSGMLSLMSGVSQEDTSARSGVTSE